MARLATNGPEALKDLRTVRPTLIFIDLYLPTLDGWVALSTIKADPRLAQIPKVAVIEPISAAYQQHLLTSGFNAHLTKPLDASRILDELSAQIPTLFDR